MTKRGARDEGRPTRRRRAVWSSAGIIAGAALIATILFFALQRPAIFVGLWPRGLRFAAILAFLPTYTVIALGKLPGFYLDRAGAALLGAALMVGLGVLPLDQALRTIDFDTIGLLLGMMIVVGNLRLSGFSALSPIGS